MRIFWAAAAAAAVLACGAARADTPAQSPANGDAAVGVSIICNTSSRQNNSSSCAAGAQVDLISTILRVMAFTASTRSFSLT